jgi:hypothetical protein
MKVWMFSLIMIGLISLGFIGTRNLTGRVKDTCTKVQKEKSARGFAVVELFTSEGCSSCPPADNLLATLQSEKNMDVFLLSYHVDYRDNTGWKDTFSKPRWTARQTAYARRFNLGTVYTPQVVVNGSEKFVGSDKLRLYTSIDNQLRHTEESDLQIKANLINGQIKVKYTLKESEPAVLNIALVQLQDSSSVTKGENTGKFLRHVNIVRDLLQVDTKNVAGENKFNIPQGFDKNAYEVVAFWQKPGNGKIITATKTTIQQAKEM